MAGAPDIVRHGTDAVRSTMVEHDARSRFVVQRGLFAGPSPLIDDDLYAEVISGFARRSRYRIDIDPHARVETNSYFGRFPASYWQRWTAITAVRTTMTYSGSGRIALVASDTDGRERTIDAITVDGDGVAELNADLDRFVDGGGLWLRMDTAKLPLAVEDLEWTVNPPASIRPAAVVVCTFNRADDCATTVDALGRDDAVMAGVDAVFVVDQGTDPVETRDKFRDVASYLGTKLVYIRQPNLGGAGGFTRGMYEVTDVVGADHANVVLMDDDILCEPETVLRLNAFANLTVEPTIVGAQMLGLFHPDRILVGAEHADLTGPAVGIPAANALVDASVVKKKQDVRVDAGYNGWWTCLIPSEIIAAQGYPLPLFFQWDDVEYAIRARGHGFATVTLPGAGVWHADFTWKDWDEWHRYFNIRNGLLVAALHSEFDGPALFRSLSKDLLRFLVGMQYGLAMTQIKAIEDFISGPRAFNDGGVAAAVDIRRERAHFDETKRHPSASVPDLRSADYQIAKAAPWPKLEGAVLAKRVLQQWRGTVVPHPVAIASKDALWWHVSLFGHAIVTDASQEGVRVRRRNKELARSLAIRGFRALWTLRRDARKIQVSYKNQFPVMVSRDNWTRLFER
ncbi:glycosyltransferase [Rhodococcus sp. BP-149]|uniref:glycosyltransferase n=1 Tax=unclassified Rhodococcus (in: high G+C Gram-positive bacteria) TaxID=192944 RepID=UPI001C9AACA2|nr:MULTISPECIES: glycosyltransferase [unclassified Rhodococcus (in: high G+C Gram-positive bacteria)]MBY6687703.1 glycosyltransferase [Rhodococcus sp. BP-288]MBY6695858.1 glycosyltransferase [Rhodococcus sp. BP-188]MBY6700334.1 glycosyltransferase [Rhodococcus sp. BP-285]MBY6704643.1 glycosyltransferase [Rhodococcus sp. BP-283]MBY6713459.1 glycosyltransferase [Rhodococcus sp. BP-160]